MSSTLRYASALTLINFKRFGEPGVRVPLAPLTLLFGANSSGKSSILQALLVMSQSWDRVDDVATLHTMGARVHLGPVSNVVHGQVWGDERKALQIGFETAIEPYDPEQTRTRVTLQYGVGAGVRSGVLEAIDIRDPDGDGLRLVPEVSESDRVRDELIDRQQFFIELLPESQDLRMARRSSLLGRLGIHVEHETFSSVWDDEATRSAARSAIIEDQTGAGNAQVLASSKPLLDLIDLVDLGWNAWFEVQPTETRVEVNVVQGDGVLHGAIIDDHAGRISAFVQHHFLLTRAFIRDVHHIGRVRHMVDRFAPLDGRRPTSVGTDGEHLAHLALVDQELRAALNSALLHCELRYRVEAVIPDGSVGGIVELHLVDLEAEAQGRVVRVGVPDVGSGVGQVLPVLMEYFNLLAQAKRGTKAAAPTLIVEQPELHLHPRLMSNLAALLAGLTRGEDGRWKRRGDGKAGELPDWRRPQVILETHSEHIVLALARQVREGVLQSSDVIMLIVQPSPLHPGQSEVQVRRFREDGTFDKPWPGGFFPERRRLAE